MLFSKEPGGTAATLNSEPLSLETGAHISTYIYIHSYIVIYVYIISMYIYSYRYRDMSISVYWFVCLGKVMFTYIIHETVDQLTKPEG